MQVLVKTVCVILYFSVWLLVQGIASMWIQSNIYLYVTYYDCNPIELVKICDAEQPQRSRR